jgi:hypothetical protein
MTLMCHWQHAAHCTIIAKRIDDQGEGNKTGASDYGVGQRKKGRERPAVVGVPETEARRRIDGDTGRQGFARTSADDPPNGLNKNVYGTLIVALRRLNCERISTRNVDGLRQCGSRRQSSPWLESMSDTNRRRQHAKERTVSGRCARQRGPARAVRKLRRPASPNSTAAHRAPANPLLNLPICRDRREADVRIQGRVHWRDRHGW